VQGWLLLRGLAREAEHWHDFPKHLSEALGLARDGVVTMDLPGFGSDAQRSAPWSVTTTVDALRSRWRSGERPDGEWALLGISLGAMVALEWTAAHPDDFERVVAVNPSDRRTAWPHQRLRWQGLPLMLRIAVCRDLARREELSLRLTSRRPDDARRRMIFAERVEIADLRPVRPGNVVRQLVAAVRWAAPEALSVPLLVIASGGDCMVDPRCSVRLADRYDAPLVVHPWGGHDLTVDASVWVAEEIAQWIESPGSSGGEPRPGP
jgi:pimeloyl-ACP methyl ester carboxylesterase